VQQDALGQDFSIDRSSQGGPGKTTVYATWDSKTDFRYTVVEGDKLLKEQTSVIRTNCMDCLDRTNVVQSTLARTVITRQLIDCGIFKDTDRVDMFPDFERMFRNSTSLPPHSE
jgi:hypothetical protein